MCVKKFVAIIIVVSLFVPLFSIHAMKNKRMYDNTKDQHKNCDKYGRSKCKILNKCDRKKCSNEVFKTAKELYSHLCEHAEDDNKPLKKVKAQLREKKFKCPVIDCWYENEKLFDLKANHLIFHTHHRSFLCTVCNEAFHTKGLLTRHKESKFHRRKKIYLEIDSDEIDEKSEAKKKSDQSLTLIKFKSEMKRVDSQISKIVNYEINNNFDENDIEIISLDEWLEEKED